MDTLFYVTEANEIYKSDYSGLYIELVYQCENGSVGNLEMLRQAGVGVLMKNANPDLREEGLHISEFTNDEDGVAKFLVTYFNV